MTKQKYVNIISMVVLLLVSPYIAHALHVETHKRINKLVAEGSFNGFFLTSYLINNLNIKKGIRELVIDKEISEWIETGGEAEDRTPRYLNHFHQPITNKGLWGIYNSAVEWTVMDPGTQEQPFGDDYSWHDVRNYFHKALITVNKTDRDDYFARTFQGIGQLLHMIQDMSVPEHTRDDGHLLPAYEAWVKNPKNVTISSYAPIFFDQTALRAANPLVPDLPVINLFDTNTYNGQDPGNTVNNTIGLSEYTNANFLSPDTMFLEHPDYPYPSVDSVKLWHDPTNNRWYLEKDKDGEPVKHLAVVSYLFKYAWVQYKGFYLPVKLDTECYKEYASHLLPRAIGYSANLLEYFFRGRLEITAPDRYVYGVTDPATRQFTEIKLKLKNTTPDEEMGAGKLTAVMKYRLPLMPDFDPVANPPLTTDYLDYSDQDWRNNYSYSVSQPVEVGSVSSATAQEVTFTFSDPVPTNATDLSLMVVYRGKLGLEEDAIVAQYKDLCEPDNIKFWNLSDYFCLNAALYTPSEIGATEDLWRQLDFNDDDKIDKYYFRSKYNIYVTFSSKSDPDSASVSNYTVAFEGLPSGDYGEVVVLQDQDIYYFSILYKIIDNNPGDDLYPSLPHHHTFEMDDGINALKGIKTYLTQTTVTTPDPMGIISSTMKLYWYYHTPAKFRGIPCQHSLGLYLSYPSGGNPCGSSSGTVWPDALGAQSHAPIISQ